MIKALAAVAAVLSAGAVSAKPLHYDMKASVAPAAGSLAVDLAIRIPAEDTSKGPITFILGRGYRINSASAGAQAAVSTQPTDTPWAGLQSVTVTPRRPGRPITLKLAYAGPLGPSGQPPLNTISPSLIELNLDSGWTPVRADLSGAFTLDAEIRGVPRDLVAVAPGKVTRRGEAVLIDRDTPQVDAAFVAMRGLKAAREGGFELYADDLDGEYARTYRRRGAEALAFLERWFGAMPGRPARVVMVRRERVSGYARPGYVVLTQTPRPGGERGLAKFIAHEFAHAWWSSGDSTGEDRWLSESTAEYIALRYVEDAFGLAARDEMLAEKRERAAAAGPVLGRGLRGDPVLYNKGPVLLFELEQKIGRPRMDRLMAGLAKAPPANTRAFLHALSSTAGQAAAEAFEAALRA
jgi:hypothetical protein